MTAPATVFCQLGCARRRELTAWLAQLGIPFVVRDALTDATAEDEVIALGFLSLPVLVTPDGRAAVGPDDVALRAALPLLRGGRDGDDERGRGRASAPESVEER